MMFGYVETPVSPLMHVDMNHVSHVMLCFDMFYISMGITMHHHDVKTLALLRHIINVVKTERSRP